MADRQQLAATALDMTARQRDISVSEFFLKNRHHGLRYAPKRRLSRASRKPLPARKRASFPKFACMADRYGKYRVVVEDNGPGVFARSQELGWIGLALAILATVSLFAVGVREAIGLLRLATMENLHRSAADAILSDNRIEGRTLVQDLIAHSRGMPRLARARARGISRIGSTAPT